MIVVSGSDILLKTLHVLWLFSLGSILVNCAKKKAEKGLEKTNSQQSLAKSGAKTPKKSKKEGTTSGSAKNEDEEDDVQFNLKLKPAEQKRDEFDDDEENPLAKIPTKARLPKTPGAPSTVDPERPFLAPNEKMNNNSCYIKPQAKKA
ncbi:unnamed protein product [Caenorhabditis sp. 36 PRJEB53466]|nr:unnamed protein product [Caenorhabditis sp. 36 PRJEB53466]